MFTSILPRSEAGSNRGLPFSTANIAPLMYFKEPMLSITLLTNMMWPTLTYHAWPAASRVVACSCYWSSVGVSRFYPRRVTNIKSIRMQYPSMSHKHCKLQICASILRSVLIVRDPRTSSYLLSICSKPPYATGVKGNLTRSFLS